MNECNRVNIKRKNFSFFHSQALERLDHSALTVCTVSIDDAARTKDCLRPFKFLRGLRQAMLFNSDHKLYSNLFRSGFPDGQSFTAMNPRILFLDATVGFSGILLEDPAHPLKRVVLNCFNMLSNEEM